MSLDASYSGNELNSKFLGVCARTATLGPRSRLSTRHVVTPHLRIRIRAYNAELKYHNITRQLPPTCNTLPLPRPPLQCCCPRTFSLRHPVHVHVVPRRECPNFAALNCHECVALLWATHSRLPGAPAPRLDAATMTWAGHIVALRWGDVCHPTRIATT